MANKKVLAVYLILLSMFPVITAIQRQGMLFFLSDNCSGMAATYFTSVSNSNLETSESRPG